MTDGTGSGLDDRTVPVSELLDQLDRLEQTVDNPDERREVEQTRELAERLSDGVFGERIRKYTGQDVAESFVGSIVFAVPLLVEDGVNVIAQHFLSTQAAGVPAYLLANVTFVVLLAGALIYWADIQRVEEPTKVMGVPVPRRLIGTLLVAFLTTAALMTLWGRIEWAQPVVALARVTVVWTVASVGAALGDILPGESTGTDLTAGIEEEIRERLD